MGAIMKKCLIVGLSMLASACSSNDSDYEIKYFEHENGVLFGSGLAYSLYSEVVENEYFKPYKSSKSLSSDYKLKFIDSIGAEVSNTSYSVHSEINKAIKKCSKIKFDKSDFGYKGDIFDRIFGYSEDYYIVNKDKINEIKSCANKAMNDYPVDLDNLARFMADDRLDRNKSGELDKLLKEVKSDGKFTFNELISVYKVLDKNIELNIKDSFINSN